MKILHIMAGAAQGGAETYFTDAIAALADKGVEQFAITRAHDAFIKTMKDCGIRHAHMSFSRLSKLWEVGAIKKIIEREKPDLVHAWMARAASFVPKNLSMPALGWFGGPYDLKYYKNCSALMGVTKGLEKYLNENAPKNVKTFCVHTFGTLKSDEKELSHKDFDIPDDAKTVLLLSRMHWKKGVDTLLKAASDIPDAYFLLAGDGELLEEYKALSKKLGLENSVRFLGWRTDRSALLKLADVCTLPSRYEPFGTVMAEAWGAGVPLVAAKADGALQYVIDGQNGLLCEIDDASGLARQLKTALHNNECRKKIIAGGTKTYDEMFSKDVAISSLINAYKEIIS